MNEAAYQRRITDFCDYLKLRWFHSGDSRRDSCAGFPDLVICGPGGLVFAELKSEQGKVSAEQFAWLDDLNQHAPAHVWWPSDWTLVEATLRELARPR